MKETKMKTYVLAAAAVAALCSHAAFADPEADFWQTQPKTVQQTQGQSEDTQSTVQSLGTAIRHAWDRAVPTDGNVAGSGFSEGGDTWSRFQTPPVDHPTSTAETEPKSESN
jgi:hypothetical protein